MAHSTITRQAALEGLARVAQHLITTQINVVSNKADIVFTRLDSELKSNKALLKSAVTGAQDFFKAGDLQYVIMPVVPSELPKVETVYNHETFGSLDGEIAVMGVEGLKRVTLDNYLVPSSPFKYPFCRAYGSTAARIIEFFEKAHKDRIPLRITIAYHNGGEYLNMPCLIENLAINRDAVNDMFLTISLIEYVDLRKSVQTTVKK